VGNVVGSNIFNLGFILGGCALIRPILTSRPLVYRDASVLIAITVLLGFFISDLDITRVEGLIMLGGLAAYLTLLYWQRVPLGHDEGGGAEDDAEDDGSIPKDLGIAVVALAMIIGGSEALVWGASGLARAFGMSEWTIGVTVVAAGTSAPEVVTSLTAVLKGKHGISAGGLIGSDVFNLLGVLGVASTIHPMVVAQSSRGSVFLLIGMVVLTTIFMRSGWQVSRREGFALVAIAALRWYADMTEMDLGSIL
jgi:cation:H+ antiporter